MKSRRSQMLVDEIEALRAAFRYVMTNHPFAIDAMVVLPDHLHAVWSLPLDDADYATRWRLIKSHFSRSQSIGERRSKSRESKGERGIWQRRYWEHRIRDELDYSRHVDYIHFNPVKHRYVDRVADWAHSSFHRYVRDEILPIDWAGDLASDAPQQFWGERE